MIDKATSLIELERFADAQEHLDRALATALVNQDHAAQFFIYHARWRGRMAADDRERADLELSAAQYALRYVDEDCPEARDIRATLARPKAGAKAPRISYKREASSRSLS